MAAAAAAPPPAAPSLDTAAQRFLRRAQLPARADASASLSRLAAIDDLGDVAAAAGSRPECAKIAKHVLAASIQVLSGGVSTDVAHSIRRMLVNVWGWLDDAVVLQGHQTLVDAIAAVNVKDTGCGRRVAGLCIAASAAYALAGDLGVDGPGVVRLVDALVGALPAVEKLQPCAAKIAILDVAGRGAATAAGLLPAPGAYNKDMKFARLASAALKDRDAAVRAAGYRVLGATATGVATPQVVGAQAQFYDQVVAACVKGVAEDRNAGTRTAAAEALATALHTAFAAAVERAPDAAVKDAAAASDGASRSRWLFGRSSKPQEAHGPGHCLAAGLATLRGAFTKAATAEVREAVAHALRLFLTKTGAYATQRAPYIVQEIIRFVTAPEFASGASFLSTAAAAAGRAGKETELLHACRCVSSVLAEWAGGCGSDAARVAIVKELLTYLHALTPQAAGAAGKPQPTQASSSPPPPQQQQQQGSPGQDAAEAPSNAAGVVSTQGGGVAAGVPPAPPPLSGVYEDFRGVFEPASTVALWVLPDILWALGAPGLEGCAGLRDAVIHALFASGSQCHTARQRTDSALVLKTLTDITPAHRPADQHLLLSILIHHSGNALCGIGTRCDHEAIRSMLTAGQSLLGILSARVLSPDPAIQRQLSEVCNIAFPSAPYDVHLPDDPCLQVSRKASSGGKAAAAGVAASPPQGGASSPLTPVDPQLQTELACLLEACGVCCGGYRDVLKTLGVFTERLAPVLHGADWPAQPGHALATLRARSNVLLAMLSVLKFVAADGQDVQRLAKLIHPAFIEGLEDTFNMLYAKSIPSDNEVINIALCRVRTLAFQCVAMMPSTSAAGALYAQAVKSACALLTASLHVAVVTVVPGMAAPAVPPHRRTNSSASDACIVPAGLRPLPLGGNAGSTISGVISEWSCMIDAPSPRGACGALRYESQRQCPLAELYNTAVHCLGAVFAGWGKNNKKVVMDRLKEGVLACADLEKREKASGKKATPQQICDARTVQLNMTAAALSALTRSAAHTHDGREVWGKDAVLCTVARDAIALAKAGLGSPCVWTRTAAAEIIGVTMALAGTLADPFDAYLPTVVTRTLSCEAAALAQCIGGLHGHDGQNRADVLGLSLSYIAKLLQCDAAAPSPLTAVAPHALTSLARLLRTVEPGPHTATAIETAMALACDRLLAAGAGPTPDAMKQVLQSVAGNKDVVDFTMSPGQHWYDAVAAEAAVDVAGSLVEVLKAAAAAGHDATVSTSTVLCVRALVKSGLECPAAGPRRAARGVIVKLLEPPEGVRALPKWQRALQRDDDVAVWLRGALDDVIAASAAAREEDVAAAVAVLHAASLHAPGVAAQTLGPKPILKLLDVHVTGRSALIEAGGALIHNAADLIRAARHDSAGGVFPPPKQPLPVGCCRVLEWVQEATAVLLVPPPHAFTPAGSVAVHPAAPDAAGDDTAAAAPGIHARLAAIHFLTRAFEVTPAPVAWLAAVGTRDGDAGNEARGDLDRAIHALLATADDTSAPPLRAAALTALAVAVDRFAHVRDSGFLSPHAFLLSDRAKAGLARTAPPPVVAAAAGLAAEVLIADITPEASAKGVFSVLASTFVEYGQDRCAKVVVAQQLCRVVAAAEDVQAVRNPSPDDHLSHIRGSRAPTMAAAAAILAALAGKGVPAGTEPTVVRREVKERCRTLLEDFAVLSGLDDGWIVVEGRDCAPLTREMLGSIRTAVPHFLRIAAGTGAVSPAVVLGTAALVLRGGDDVAVAATLRGLEAAALHIGASGTWDGAQRRTLVQLVKGCAGMGGGGAERRFGIAVRAQALACLAALADAARELVPREDLLCIVLSAGALVRGGGAGVAFETGAVRNALAAAGTALVRLVDDACEGGTGGASATAAAALASLLLAAEALPRGAASPTTAPAPASLPTHVIVHVMHRLVSAVCGGGRGGGASEGTAFALHAAVAAGARAACARVTRGMQGASAPHAGVELQEGYSEAMVLLFAEVACRRAAGGAYRGSGRSVLDEVRGTLTRGLQAEAGALQVLLGLRRFFIDLKRRGVVARAAEPRDTPGHAVLRYAVKELSLLCAVAGGAAGLPVAPPPAADTTAPATPVNSGCTVKAVELLLDTMISTHGLYAEAEFRACLSLAIATLSIAAEAPANAPHMKLLYRCLLQLAQRYPALFRDLMPSLDPTHVTTLRRQMAAAQAAVTAAKASPPRVSAATSSGKM